MTRSLAWVGYARTLGACLALLLAAPPAHAIDVGGLKCETADADFVEAEEMQAAGVPVIGYKFEQAEAHRLIDAMSRGEVAPHPGDEGTVTIDADDVGVILAIGYRGRQDALIRFYDASRCLMVAGPWPWNDLVVAMREAGLAW
jgi:hypothetical protein